MRPVISMKQGINYLEDRTGEKVTDKELNEFLNYMNRMD